MKNIWRYGDHTTKQSLMAKNDHDKKSSEKEGIGGEEWPYEHGDNRCK